MRHMRDVRKKKGERKKERMKGEISGEEENFPKEHETWPDSDYRYAVTCVKIFLSIFKEKKRKERKSK